MPIIEDLHDFVQGYDGTYAMASIEGDEPRLYFLERSRDGDMHDAAIVLRKISPTGRTLKATSAMLHNVDILTMNPPNTGYVNCQIAANTDLGPVNLPILVTRQLSRNWKKGLYFKMLRVNNQLNNFDWKESKVAAGLFHPEYYDMESMNANLKTVFGQMNYFEGCGFAFAPDLAVFLFAYMNHDQKKKAFLFWYDHLIGYVDIPKNRAKLLAEASFLEPKLSDHFGEVSVI